jgi:hypothetical protein
MRLIRADGNIDMQRALSHPYVKTIVDILVEHKDTLDVVAEVLQQHIQRAEPSFAKTLAGIRAIYSQFDSEGNPIIPTYINNLIATLDQLYRQNNEKIRVQRGAIVELFGRRLVCPRYNTGQECSNSQRFVDDRGQFITIQEVDVAALSHERLHVEGYECKLKADGLTSDDCIDLAHLLKAAQESNYHANAGIISFDNDKRIRRRLNHLRPTFEHLPESRSIKAYGLESIRTLQNSPF